MPKRRARGTGAIYQIRTGRKAGWYAATISLGIDGRGKRRRVYIVRKLQSEVAVELAKRMAKIADDGPPTNDKSTLAAFLTRWLEDVVRTTTRAKTHYSYAGTMRTHVVPLLGNKQIAKITPQQCQWMFAELERRGASPRTRQNVYAILRRAFQQALRWNIIARNPMGAVDRPRVAHREMSVWTIDEQQRFLDETRADRYWALYVLALATGMRQGELLGLRWDDIDLKAGTIAVQRALVYVNGKLTLDEAKTKASRRRITLPPLALEALRVQKEHSLGNGHRAVKWVFPAPEGGPLSARNFMARWFYPLFGVVRKSKAKKARPPVAAPTVSVPRIRFHDFRHTCATTLLSIGIHPKVVQETLGHTTVRTTLDLYSHVLPAMQSDAAARWDAALSKRVG